MLNKIGAILGSLLLLAWSSSYAEETQVFSNRDYRFTFTFPASWRSQAATSPNTRAKISSSSSAPNAGCSVTAGKMSQLDGMSQGDLDQLLLQSPPERAQYQASFSQAFSNVSLPVVSQGRLGGRVAHLIRVRYSASGQSGTEYLSLRMAKTFSPGLSWVLTCAGTGKTPDAAERAFQYWQSAINNVFITFRFQ